MVKVYGKKIMKKIVINMKDNIEKIKNTEKGFLHGVQVKIYYKL